MQVSYGTGTESESGIPLAGQGHSQFEHANQGASGYASFRHPAAASGLEQEGAPSRNGHHSISSVHRVPRPQLLQPDDVGLASGHIPHGIPSTFYNNIPRNSHTPSTPSNASPRFSAISASPQQRQVASTSFAPVDRQLPSSDVSDETIDEAYAAFILYCNPNFATTMNTSELTRLFRTPPKSEGKEFSTWSLFELIQKLESKEIKTWNQLALDLGVEPPDADKGQSTQKVQQYSVRLKRWMRAMHIDAFFEYLMGKQHPYYLRIPPPHDPFPEDGRDGVPLEEDLAVRALDPKFRPKRGRKRADEGGDEADFVDGPRKRPQVDTSVSLGNALQPQSAYPHSAHPENIDGFLETHDPWTASSLSPSVPMTALSAPNGSHANKGLTPYSASPISGQQLHWRVNMQDNPQTPHPLSTITPHSAHPDYFDEPQSAITPSSSKGRARRRHHGPAVSSAWLSNNTSSTGKLRGRPPNNKSFRNGPYVTFPANPKTKEGHETDGNKSNLSPAVERTNSEGLSSEQPHFRFPPTPASAVSPTTIENQLQRVSQRGHRLSLKVPQNNGNPVHLVTPTVLVTEEQDLTPASAWVPPTIPADSGHGSSLRASPSHYYHGAPGHNHTQQLHSGSASQTQPSPLAQVQSVTTDSPIPVLPSEAVHRALAAEIVRAPLSGRRNKRLKGAEAKNLAAAIVHPLLAKPTAPYSPVKVMGDQILGIAICSCLGLTGVVGLGAGGPKGGIKRIECTRFRINEDGYESAIDDDDDDENAAAAGSSFQEGANVRETFDVYFSVSFGGLAGEWTAKGLLATPSPDDPRTRNSTGVQEIENQDAEPNTMAGWKSKYLEAMRKIREGEEESQALKNKILETVL